MLNLTATLGKKSFCLVLLFIVGLNVYGRDFGSRFNNYGVNDGLPSAEVYQVIQDSKGYVWFGTDRGLVRYNGYEFTIFTVADGLSSNVIFHLDEGINNQIWVCGKDNRLHYIQNNTFHEFKYNDTLVSKLSNTNNVLCFNVHEKGIYLGAFSKNYYIEMGYDGSYRCLSDKKGVFIEEDEIGIRAGSNEFSPSNIYLNGELYYELDTSDLIIKSSFVNVVRNGIFIYLTIGNHFLTFWEEEGQIKKRLYKLNGEILDLQKDTYGNIYICTRHGLLKWNGETKKSFTQLIADKPIPSVLIDKDDGVWASSIYNGLFYSKKTGNNHLFNGESVIGAMCKKENEMYYQTLSNELKRFNNFRDFDLNKIDVLPLESALPVNTSLILFPGSRTGNRIVLDSLTNNYWLKDIYAFGILKDSAGYLSLNSSRITRFDKDLIATGSYQFTEYLNGFDWVDNESLIVVTDEGAKTVSLSGSEVFEIVNGVKHYSYVIEDYKPEIAYFKHGIRGVKVISDSLIVFASAEAGLYFDFKFEDDVHLTKEDGLVTNSFHGIVYDEGNIIGLSKEGISLLNDSLDLINYTEENNLLSNDVYDVIVRSDSIWVLTDLGISCFPLEKNNNPDIKINLVEVTINGELQKNRKKYEVNAEDNPIVISFEALLYSKEGKINYRYQLKGLDKDWVTTKNRTIRYLNVPSGNYQLLVSVENPDKSWTETIQLLEIHKLTPYWRQWWFLTIGILAFLGVIFTIIYLLGRRTLSIQKQKIKVLNLERKTLQAQINPHFIFNSLTSLQNLIIKDDKEESQEFLGQFAQLTRLALNHSTKNQITISSEINFLKNYIELEKIRFGQGFDFKIEMDGVDKSIEIPPMLIQPFVENAILHGLSKKKEGGNLRIVFSKRDAKTILVNVIDNGGGRVSVRVGKTNTSLGIKLIKERLDILVNERAIEIIDLKKDGQPCGTHVKVILPFK